MGTWLPGTRWSRSDGTKELLGAAPRLHHQHAETEPGADRARALQLALDDVPRSCVQDVVTAD